MNDQAGHSRDAISTATSFKLLNRSMETILTWLSRTNERSEKSKRVFKRPSRYKDESDGCKDTWIEVMRLHFEEEGLTEDKNAVSSPAFWKGQLRKLRDGQKAILPRMFLKSC